KGSYQKENIQTAAVVIEVLRKKISISQEAIERGFANVVKNTGIKGRWQILNEKPLIIADTAHNKEGLSLVLKQIKQQKFNNLHIVLGMVNDKAIDEILDLFPKDAVYYISEPDVPRKLDKEILFQKARNKQLNGNVFNTVKEALNVAKSEAKENDMIYIGGSTFVVAEVV
ncbi:MAG: bifunctional folylpolyglutamate synthase/dihydrofolate synthase, partial [Bacteroidetes bacterium]